MSVWLLVQHLAVLDKTVVTPRVTRTVLDRVRLVVRPHAAIDQKTVIDSRGGAPYCQNIKRIRGSLDVGSSEHTHDVFGHARR